MSAKCGGSASRSGSVAWKVRGGWIVPDSGGTTRASMYVAVQSSHHVRATISARCSDTHEGFGV